MLRSRCLRRGASLIISILRRIVEGRVEFLYALGALLTRDYPTKIGVHRLHPSTSLFVPGYDPATVESPLGQSSHLMSSLKISMACWLVADEAATRRQVSAARENMVYRDRYRRWTLRDSRSTRRASCLPRPVRGHRRERDR